MTKAIDSYPRSKRRLSERIASHTRCRTAKSRPCPRSTPQTALAASGMTRLQLGEFMGIRTLHAVAIVGVSIAGFLWGPSAMAQSGAEATAKEIKIGQTAPYSGPASAFGLTGRVMRAYFDSVNATGGINGRKINFISVDDGYSPAKTVEQTRRLVESDEVLAVVGQVGSPTSLSVAKYLNNAKVPQILTAASTATLSDPEKFPWTTTFWFSQSVEAGSYAKWVLANKPQAKIAVLYQNDEFGKGYLAAFKRALGPNAETMIVKQLSYDLSDPTIDSQIVSLKASGADTFFDASTPKFTAQAIRRANEIDWKPLHFILSSSSRVSSVLEPAGLSASKGVVTAMFIKTPDDPKWRDDPDVRVYREWTKRWMPETNDDDYSVAFGYSLGQMAVELLKRCGNDLTRDNLIKQATNIDGYQLPLFIPGILVKTTPDNRTPWMAVQMATFTGNSWQLTGTLVQP